MTSHSVQEPPSFFGGINFGTGRSVITKEYPRELAQACRLRASRVAFPPLRWTLLEIADQYECEAELVEGSSQALIESRHLIAAADKLLRH